MVKKAAPRISSLSCYRCVTSGDYDSRCVTSVDGCVTDYRCVTSVDGCVTDYRRDHTISDKDDDSRCVTNGDYVYAYDYTDDYRARAAQLGLA